jgi:hypothetical protein
MRVNDSSQAAGISKIQNGGSSSSLVEKLRIADIYTSLQSDGKAKIDKKNNNIRKIRERFEFIIEKTKEKILPPYRIRQEKCKRMEAKCERKRNNSSKIIQ